MNKSTLFGIIKTWNKLSKFRLSLMNAAMPVVGLYSAMGSLNPRFATVLFTGNLFLAMSSQIFGQLYEKNYDKMMARTCNRPLVTEKVTPKTVVIIGSSLYCLGNFSLLTTCSFESILASNVSFWGYFLYMRMKRGSKWNLPIGGIVGCLPILSGATAINGLIDVNQKVLFDMAFLYAWQMTHFLQILMLNKDDYVKAGFVMLSSRQNIFYFQVLFFLLHILLVFSLPGNETKDWILKSVIATCLGYQMSLLKSFKTGVVSYEIMLKEKKLAYSVAFLYFAFYHSKRFSSKDAK